MKVIVVGTSGSGKSTLAKRISKKIGTNHIELDSIYNQSNWKPIETSEFIKIVEQRTTSTSWVACGNYFSRLGLEFWKKADLVIWLDYPFYVVLGRLLRRSFKRGLTREHLWNGNRESLRKNFLSKDSVVLHMIKTWRKQKVRYEPIFSNSTIENVSLVRLRNDRELENFLREL